MEEAYLKFCKINGLCHIKKLEKSGSSTITNFIID